ncbi:hypothetical protein KJ953_03385 [Patescibacteria group bacterium]|nr:hypothetical protein [Patescibacteria group bacterium]MBU1256717.1 hypothetical protein [Patescibacteria group bacterium]MBU1457678.1 hypothetical protein [Patescibacteria group bacterium]
MEFVPGIDIGLSEVVGVMVKALLVLITLLSLIIVRQVSLMHKVVSVHVGGNIKIVAFSFFVISLVLTGIVILG